MSRLAAPMGGDAPAPTGLMFAVGSSAAPPLREVARTEIGFPVVHAAPAA